MIKRLIILILLFVGSMLEAVDEYVIEDERKIGLEIEESDILISCVEAFDVDNRFIYILDSKQGKILKIDYRTLQLVQTISSRGQGPDQLERPVNLLLNDGKLYVLELNSCLIKIFDALSGKLIKTIRLGQEFYKTLRFNYIESKKAFAVGRDGKIYVAYIDFKKKKLVKVFAEESGQEIASLIEDQGGLDKAEVSEKFYKNYIYGVDVDNEGNIYLLFYHQLKLKKFSPHGDQIWETDIKNRYLEEIYPLRSRIRKIDKNVVEGGGKPLIFNFLVLENGNILVVHNALAKKPFKIEVAPLYSPNGKLLALFTEATFGFLTKIKNGLIFRGSMFTQGLSIRKIPNDLKKYFFKEEK